MTLDELEERCNLQIKRQDFWLTHKVSRYSHEEFQTAIFIRTLIAIAKLAKESATDEWQLLLLEKVFPKVPPLSADKTPVT